VKQEEILRAAQVHFTKAKFPDETEEALEDRLNKYIDLMNKNLRFNTKKDYERAEASLNCALKFWE
jgi:hypothetical protein